MALKKISELTEKTTLEREDKFLLFDSEDNDKPKSIKEQNLRDSVGELWAESDALPTSGTARDVISMTWTFPTGSPVSIRGNDLVLPRIPPRRSIFGVWVSSEVGGVEIGRVCVIWRPLLPLGIDTVLSLSDTQEIDVDILASSVDNKNLLEFLFRSSTLPANSIIKVYPSI